MFKKIAVCLSTLSIQRKVLKTYLSIKSIFMLMMYLHTSTQFKIIVELTTAESIITMFNLS